MVGFGCAGEGCVVSCLLTGRPNDVNPVDQRAQGEKAFMDRIFPELHAVNGAA